MTPSTQLTALVIAAYLAGSIPFGLLVGKARGVDPRTAGSHNIGATNVGRLLGVRYFFLVFCLDLLKGLAPTLAAGAVARGAADDARIYLLWLCVGFAAIAGHMFSIFLKFKGGKGVATSAGFVLGVWPYYTIAALAALLCWLLVFVLTRYVSASSIFAAAVFLPAYIAVVLVQCWPLFGPHWPLLAGALLIPAAIIFKHRENIARLRAGAEHSFRANNRA